MGVVLVVTCEAISHDRKIDLQEELTQVEVVVLSVTEDDEAANEMGESWDAVSIHSPPFAWMFLVGNLRMARGFLPLV